MRWRGIGYRAHDPRWSWAPLSGEGARLKGGRFNPQGLPALYLALSLEGMFAEMGHGFGHRLEPLTVCSYDVDVDDIVDLSTDEARDSAGVPLEDMACEWAYELADDRRPASWLLTDNLRSRGAAGILSPSFARGAPKDALNLVLWEWGATSPHRVDIFDPNRRLPSNASSWPA